MTRKEYELKQTMQGRIKLEKLQAAKSENFTQDELREYFNQLDELEQLRQDLYKYNGKDTEIVDIKKLQKKYTLLDFIDYIDKEYIVEGKKHILKHIEIASKYNAQLAYISYNKAGDDTICYLHVW